MDNFLKGLPQQLIKEKAYLEYVDAIINELFSSIKQDIIDEFDSHPVTVELENGIDAQNISGTLNGITNLYSFIGFDAGTNPITPIRERLNNINLTRIISSNGTIQYNIDMPTSKEIFSITPMPWAPGRSWARGIEEGISGIGYYLKKERNSRSGLGIQVDKQVRKNIRFRNVKYISSLIKKYTAKFKSLEVKANS